jgi:2-keto-4-pentenoate hydratase/2-oxohepta-3-ene-1,7-dioic acid hydratase in catechol pathway
MKIASFKKNGVSSFGPVTPGGVVDAGKRLNLAGLREALDAGLLSSIEALASEPADYALDEIDFLPVVGNPDKIICVGLNYATHLRETGRELPTQPMIFTRFAGSQLGHDQAILRPPESVQLDFEGELAVVIGKTGRRIPRDRAFEFIAGYACYNDGSIRDWQRHTSQFVPGKTFPRTGGFGPWLVTTDEIPDPAALEIQTRLNGEVMQQADVSDLIFDVPALIEYTSTFTELLPGDVIVTGTTGGVGAFRTPPVWMKPGDIVEVEISKIGVLRNQIADEILA